ncbi:MAG: hypothetical protein LBC68_13800 [Prevotellaceae bacterium]|jgi:uncharacterized protein (DUF3084 family)|nr:hypothetical protein [Prevotellaceae bacterium]
MEEEKTKTVKNDKTATILKVITGILCVAVIVLGALLYLESKSKTEKVEVLTNDKENLISELNVLKQEYSTLQTNNDSINQALLQEQEKIELLLEKVKKTEAGNLQKIRAYEKELGTLRAIMQDYIVQIDSLNTLNQQLVSENIQIKEQVQEITRKHDEVTQRAEELTTKVQEGSAIKARGMTVQGMTKKDKDTGRASRTGHIKTCITLIENSIAQRGMKTVYVRVKGPDGIVLTTSENNLFEVDGEQIIFSAAREIDYQGAEIELCIYYSFGDAKVAKGVYDVTAYLDGKSIGTSQLRLK